MLFSHDHDHGSSIRAYVVPDTGGTTPSVRIKSNGVELAQMEANNERPELVQAGRHATGRCGFLIDDRIVPNLASHADLEIVEAETGIIVYRRLQPNHIPDVKMFRLETHLLPLWRIDDALKNHFQYWYKSVDRRGRETATQVFCVNNSPSLFVSGRLFIKNIEYYLHQGFKSVVIFRDPYEELAERLIVLKNMSPETVALLGARDAMTFEPVMDFLGEVEQFEEEPLRRFFKRAPDEVLNPLANPLARQLSSSTPEEMPKKNSLAQALQALASFEVIGLRSEAAEFSQAMSDTLGLDHATLPVMKEYSRVIELGERLRVIADVEGLLERDLEIFHHTKEAFGSIAGV